MKHWVINQLEISHGSHASLKAMEGLRGVAVFLVFLVHYSTLIQPWLAGSAISLTNFIHGFGHLGVDLFFILSGYLIYGTIINKKTFDVAKYAQRRIIRIYPTFIVVFIIYLFLSLFFPSESKLPDETSSLILYLLQNVLLLPGLFDINPIITVAWSLSYEVFYYVIIPIVIFLFSLKKWPSNYRVWLWVMLSVVGFILAYLFGGPVRLLMFIAGILLFEMQKVQNIELKCFGTLSFILALVFFGVRSFIDINYYFSLMCVYILFAIFCLNAFSLNSFSSRWLTFSPLRWLGNMSYSYYLIHGLTLKFLFLILPFIIPTTHDNNFLYLWLLPPFFVVTLTASFCLFVIVEKPLSIDKK
ncbi:acyltransferase [Colwellia sp. RSH04]|uniref:acyltransferase family protein n=1 Tax=Colwellia sp. RSH04 TaxID=2305464 RepID=UPI000E5686C8|nr:acyltransferase [Colwellia sp. RSH04]RHW74684.1 acyltransferase [Colwellia sp. RSH04]